MSDYIKRDIERIIANAQECDIDALTWEEQKERLKAVKSADVVPVVRCKDCFLYGECQAAKFYGDDGYCSVGERKDDDKSRDTCKYYDDDWCSGACDGCPRDPSYWERKDK